MDGGPESLRRNAARFPTTQLNLVFAAAGRQNSSESEEALETLCRLYWYPLYAFIRRQGNSVEEAQDLTQGFIVRMLEKNTLQKYRQQRGRFRSFLLSCLKHFLTNERDSARALKRGGAVPAIPLDAEDRYRLEPKDGLTPEKIFEKRWALEVLNQALERVRDDCARAGKAGQFDRLRAHVTGDESAVPYRRLATELTMTEGAVKVAVHRLRQHFHRALRDLISLTVTDPTEISDEIHHLIAAIRN